MYVNVSWNIIFNFFKVDFEYKYRKQMLKEKHKIFIIFKPENLIFVLIYV